MSPIEETKERILQAAGQVFGQAGYEKATTRAIADAAGVNEVTLFRHFGSKKNLYVAAIEQNSAVPGLRAALESEMTGEYRHDLTVLGTHFLGMMLKKRTEILMSLCSAERLPEVREAISRMPDQQRQMLTGYIQEHIQRGTIRKMDPEVAAQAFLGMLFAFAINQGLLSNSPMSELSPPEATEQFVDIFVAGTTK